MSVCGFENIQELTDVVKQECPAVSNYKGGQFIRDPFSSLMEDTAVAKKGFKHVLASRSLDAIEYFLKKAKMNYILLEINFKDVLMLVREFPKSLPLLKVLLKYDLLMRW